MQKSYKYGLVGISFFIILLLIFGFTQYGATRLTRSSEGNAQQYADLKKLPSTKGGNWLRTLNASMQAVQGDLLWNSEQQLGMMRLINLPNPKTGFHYHIWAYDTQQTLGHPISIVSLSSGTGQQERYIPLTASEPVINPYKFELTLEPNAGRPQATNPLVLLMVQF